MRQDWSAWGETGVSDETRGSMGLAETDALSEIDLNKAVRRPGRWDHLNAREWDA